MPVVFYITWPVPVDLFSSEKITLTQNGLSLVRKRRTHFSLAIRCFGVNAGAFRILRYFKCGVSCIICLVRLTVTGKFREHFNSLALIKPLDAARNSRLFVTDVSFVPFRGFSLVTRLVRCFKNLFTVEGSRCTISVMSLRDNFS